MTVPVKCPICEGKGKVEPQFYPGDEGDDWKECRACHGKGTLWGFDAAPVIPAPQPYPVPYPVYPQPWVWPQPIRVTWGDTTTITTHQLPMTGGVQVWNGPSGVLSSTLNEGTSLIHFGFSAD